MLGFVAIVALISTTSAFIPEYTDDVIQKFSAVYPESGVIAAELYNSDNGMKFRADSFFNDLGVGLVPVQRPTRAEAKKEDCGNLFGIHLLDKNFCKLKFLLLPVLKEENPEEVEDYIEFSLVFDADNDPPVVIDVPVYKIPAEYASVDEAKLREWATNKKVGVFAPISNLLGDINANNEWKADFKWLSDLMSHGIFKKEPSHLTTELYTTYPLVISEADINSVFRMVEENKKIK